MATLPLVLRDILLLLGAHFFLSSLPERGRESLVREKNPERLRPQHLDFGIRA
jgi:hypothetical protein